MFPALTFSIRLIFLIKNRRRVRVWFSGEALVLKCKAKGLSPSTERGKKKSVAFKSVMVVHNHSPGILEICLETTLEHAVRFHRELEANLSTA